MQIQKTEEQVVRGPLTSTWGYLMAAMLAIGGAASMALIGGIERAGYLAVAGFVSAAIFAIAVELSRARQ